MLAMADFVFLWVKHHKLFILGSFFWNSRHPEPRRMRKGGPELRLLTPYPLEWRIPRIPGIPRMNS